MIFAKYKGHLFVTNYQNGKCTLVTNKKFDNNFKSIILPNVFVSCEFDLTDFEMSCICLDLITIICKLSSVHQIKII